MIDIFRNGVLQERSVFEEVSSTSLRYTDTDNPLEEGDVIAIRHNLSEGITIGDLRIVSSYSDLARLRDIQFNSIAVVTELKKFYHYGINGWKNGTFRLRQKYRHTVPIRVRNNR